MDNTNNNYYCVHYFRYSLYIRTFRNLSLDEAYKICTPEEAMGIYPNNKWHVMLKYAVINHFNTSNEKLKVSFEEMKENEITDKSEKVKYGQEYHIEKQK
jgi:hypothetical protein